MPEDGGAHRDLRAEGDQADEDAQLTARLPPPSALALDRTVTGPNLWFGAEKSARAGRGGEPVAVPEDGGAHRDLRAEGGQAYEAAQLTARLPPPSALALERTATGRDL